MKIVLRGGYNKFDDESLRNSFWYEYSDHVSNALESDRRVALVTLAKPDGEYDSFIKELMNGVEVIGSKVQDVEWDKFDSVLIPGGNSLNLYEGLRKLDFSLEELKEDAFVVGDSAGAYVLSSRFFYSPQTEERGEVLEFCRGFNPRLNNITIAHTNNPRFTNQLVRDKIQKYAEDNNLEILMLEENEEKEFNI